MRVDFILFQIRRVALHTSAFGFSLDFAHALFGRGMLFLHVWERTSHLCVSWAAFAATLIVYIDGHSEKERERAANCKESANDIAS